MFFDEKFIEELGLHEIKRTITKEKLDEILEKHKLWLAGVPGVPGGERANFRGNDLRCISFFKANLRLADLRDADLRDADLSMADLGHADLTRADLRGAKLYGTNLHGSKLCFARLDGADLRNTDISGADLSGADLTRAVVNYPIACPEKGPFIGYKKACGYRASNFSHPWVNTKTEFIVELLIPYTALRSSATTRKCRCSEAKVISITTLDGKSTDITEVYSSFDRKFTYKVGETVKVENFDTNRWNECAPGIHFFITRQEAVEY